MKYNLKSATNDDINYLKRAKLYNIFEYAKDLPSDEVEKINKYVNQNIPLDINSYKRGLFL